MNRLYQIALVLLCTLLLPGCYDQMNLEDASISLMLGLDVDDNGQLLVYLQSPVFSREAKEKSETVAVTADTIRLSRTKFDAVLTGITTGGKLQTILIGKRLLQQKDWFTLFDIFYRVPRLTETSRAIIVDGPVKEIFEFKPADKPRLSLHMSKLIDTSNQTNITVLTNLQELRRQMKEKGMTPSLSLIKKEKDNIFVTGTALLNKKDAMVGQLSLQESTLLLILQGQIHGVPSMVIVLGSTKDEEDSDKEATIKDAIAFDVATYKRKVRTAVVNGRFQFDIDLKLNIVITTLQMVDLNLTRNNKTEIEKITAAELTKQMEALIRKCQTKSVDPFGFGLYARAYQYKSWKNIQNEWGTAFADADVRIHVKTNIKSMGVTE
ncbi:Ger(x)C family spore germination protein [Paenibacillus sp. OV219]|uniref:Ger(x)C family spore germination protein n=1 Tax=Paenibacillus sp. OV219 TaxID=1884377 RepID=UPI0008D5638D|nr:Ger(x)C family spore germination protein [Paenibacillus sp. OV219]SEN80493.1 germination protein, Ger(x)C family [Paenibacillus sp. OV219]